MQGDADALISRSGALFERELRGQREGGVAQARQVEAGDVHVLDGDGGVGIERTLHAGGEFAGVGGRGVEAGVGAIDGVREAIDRRGQRAAAGEREDADGVGADGVLFEAVDAVLLNGIVQEGERIAVVEEAGAGAEDPRAAAVRLPGDAETRGEVVRWGGERGGQALRLRSAGRRLR